MGVRPKIMYEFLERLLFLLLGFWLGVMGSKAVWVDDPVGFYNKHLRHLIGDLMDKHIQEMEETRRTKKK